MKNTIYPLLFAVSLLALLLPACTANNAPNDRESFGVSGKVQMVKEEWKDNSDNVLTVQKYHFSPEGILDKINFHMQGLPEVVHSFNYDDEGYIKTVFQKDSAGRTLDSISYHKSKLGDTIVLTSIGNPGNSNDNGIQYKLYFLKGLLVKQTQTNPATGFEAKLMFDYNKKNWLTSSSTIYQQDTTLIRFQYRKEDDQGNWTVRESLDSNHPGINQVQTRTLQYYK